MKFSGCNYWINQGKYPEMPLGTATSMHDCEGCEKLNYCLVSKDTEVWKYNKEEMLKKWNKTVGLIEQNQHFIQKGEL